MEYRHPDMDEFAQETRCALLPSICFTFGRVAWTVMQDDNVAKTNPATRIRMKTKRFNCIIQPFLRELSFQWNDVPLSLQKLSDLGNSL
jgi:hypothetical protein